MYVYFTITELPTVTIVVFLTGCIHAEGNDLFFSFGGGVETVYMAEQTHKLALDLVCIFFPAGESDQVSEIMPGKLI